MSKRFLILGGGLMAANHVQRFATIDGADVVGLVEPRQDTGAAFAAKHGIDHVFASLDDALDWGAFDAVVNVTPDAVHHATTMQALNAGFHVLCEKPLATSHADALEMANAAAAGARINMVNLSYREVPAMREAARLVSEGAIGAIRHLEASYLQSWLTQDAWGDWRTEPGWLWRLSTPHGSKGVLGDVGIHILDFATHVAGEDVVEVGCNLHTFDKTAGPEAEAYTLDANDSAVMSVALSGGALGSITATRFASGHLNDLFLRIYGEDGGIDIRYVDRKSTLRICDRPNMRAAVWREVETPDVPTNQQVFFDALESGTPASPDFSRGAALQGVLDAAEMSDAEEGRRIRIR